MGLPIGFTRLLPLHPVRHNLKEAMRDGSRGRFLGVRRFLVGSTLLAILLLGLSLLAFWICDRGGRVNADA